MMDGSFVQELKNSLTRPMVLPVQGQDRLVHPSGWVDATPKQAAPVPLQVGTLTGFVDYVKTNVDGLPLEQCLVHVKDPSAVELRAKIEDEAAQYRRQTHLVASTAMVGGSPFTFGQYQDAELFFIGLQSGFVPTPEREEILALIASIRESTVRDTVDSGVAQEVKTGKGVVLVGQTRVPNPVTLQPWRTFREVEQPVSLFVLRLQSAKEGDKPRCALFEADGGSWKLTAVLRVAKYLQDALGQLPVVIG